VHSRLKRTVYGGPDFFRETSVVYVGRLNSASFIVLGSPSQVFALLELNTSREVVGDPLLGRWRATEFKPDNRGDGKCLHCGRHGFEHDLAHARCPW
jgi:hypothetical protein